MYLPRLHKRYVHRSAISAQKNCIVEASVEICAKCRARKASRESCIAETLIEIPSKCHALKASTKSCVVEALVDFGAKFPALNTTLKSCVVKDLVEKKWPHVKLWRALGGAASSRFLLNLFAERQALKAAGQSRVVQALVDVNASWSLHY